MHNAATGFHLSAVQGVCELLGNPPAHSMPSRLETCVRRESCGSRAMPPSDCVTATLVLSGLAKALLSNVAFSVSFGSPEAGKACTVAPK